MTITYRYSVLLAVLFASVMRETNSAQHKRDDTEQTEDGPPFTADEIMAAENVVLTDDREGSNDLDPGTDGSIADRQEYEFISGWPKGEVPYVLDSKLSKKQRRDIIAAMGLIEKTSCIRFIFRNKSNMKKYPNYIFLRVPKLMICQANGGIGYNAAVAIKPIDLHRTCPLGSIAHEFLHILGFMHEQARVDRDKFVHVYFENIAKQEGTELKNTKHQFEIRQGGFANLAGRYDYNSIMHYGSNFFAKPKTETIVPYPKKQNIGQRKNLSPGDISRLNAFYHCKK